jgi:hypothetical protein
MKIGLKWTALAIGATLLVGCSAPEENKVNVSINVEEKAPSASEGFDLEQFHKLLIEEGENENQWDAKFLSDLVNRKDINNLDLNRNGTVDTILVEPFDDNGKRGFQLYTKVMDYEGMDKDEEQSICTVMVEQQGDKGNLTVSGNEQMYGTQHHYHSSGLSNFFLMYWLMSPRFSYGPGFYGGYAPAYPPRAPMSSADYRGNIDNRNAAHTGRQAPTPERPSTVQQAAVQQKTAAKGVKSTLANPTSSQRSFQTQTQTKSSAASGFGKKSTGTTGGSTTSGRSRSGGGGK